VSNYNYSVFDMEREEPVFEAFPSNLHVGERAPNFELEDLASGEMVSLRSLASSGVAVLEFGSFT
jgi:hypothetical protein